MPTIDATIMIPLTPFVLALSSMTTVSALTVNSPSLILPGSAKTNATGLNYIHLCEGSVYGYDLDIASCTEALDQIDSTSTTEQTYGARFTGPYDVKLPFRYISCSFPPDPGSRVWQSGPPD